MAEPATNHIDLDAGLEQMDGRGVAEDVRADLVCAAAGPAAASMPVVWRRTIL